MRGRTQFIIDVGFAVSVLAVLAIDAATARAADQPLAEAGRQLVAEHCQSCHAIGAAGASPVAAAPPLRELYHRYPDEALTQAFEQGLINSHPSMPTFRFSQSELRAILAYLKSIQEMQDA